MNKLTRILLYLFIFTVPFENSTRFLNLPFIDSLTTLFVVLLGVSSIFAVIINGRIKKAPFVYALLLLFASWIIASLYWGTSFSTSLVFIALYLQSFFITWVTFEFIDTKEKVHNVLKAFVLGCTVILIQAIYSHFISSKVISLNNMFLMEGYNNNALGVIWVLGIVMAIYLTFKISKKYALYIPFATFMVLLTASRTAAILLALVLLASLWYMFRYKVRYRKAITIATILITLFTILLLPQGQLERLSTINDEISAGDLNGRTAIWQSGISALKESPYLGVGIGSFKEVSAAYSIYEKENSSHNSYLTILVETGIFGFIIFIVFLLGLFISAVRTKGDATLRWLNTMLIILWLTLSIASHAELQKYTWIIFGIVITSNYISRKPLEEVKKTVKTKTKRLRFKRYRIVWSK